jgi:hypothetical protein
MCPEPSWWQTGLSLGTILVVALVSPISILSMAAGWAMHSIRQWWRRMMVFIRGLISGGKATVKPIGLLIVLGFVAYAWLFH